MSDVAVLISLPTESVAVRATVASLVAVAAIALLLRRGLRVPRVRCAAVLIPAAALLVAVLTSWGDQLLPTVMTATDADGALPLRVNDAYLRVAPVGWPLAAVWLAVVALRVIRRVVAFRRMHRVASSGGTRGDVRVVRILRSVAATLRLSAPAVAIVDGCPGSAVVVGIRRPTVVIDAGLLRTLDDEELEGLLAHELSHIRHRDNLIGLLVGLMRDVFFFVPGGRWVTRRLREERELAADHVAVAATARPGALASGLLKVIDSQQPVACAAFAAPAAVVSRVERLLADARPETPLRTGLEGAAVATALAVAILVAGWLPAAVAGQSVAGDALAVLWAWRTQPASQVTAEATALAVFRRNEPAPPPPPVASSGPFADGHEFHPAVLRGVRPAEPTLIATPAVVTRPGAVDARVLDNWRARPVVTSDGGVAVYWLRRIETVG